MSRIIAGATGGLRLTSVSGDGTRPTTDRVKEAIFSRLESYGVLSGAVVVDLYAGSGALGLEAVSRGAASADLVEFHSGAARVCSANAKAVSSRVPGSRVRVHPKKVESYAASMIGPVDLVFMDPPYSVTNAHVTEILTALRPHLAPEAVVVLERGKRTGAPEWPDGLVLDAEKNYGETTVFYLEIDDDEPSSEAEGSVDL
jgi:16S rRNA (guanine966-N2)-methyltransferase